MARSTHFDVALRTTADVLMMIRRSYVPTVASICRKLQSESIYSITSSARNTGQGRGWRVRARVGSGGPPVRDRIHRSP